jgi:Na+-transporting methylmalonyl-CoA/oxaloacetate decarboxylase gamma subunit
MNNMVIALEITALGMGLVFGAIILLWWMMDLLTWLTADKGPVPDSAANASVMNEDLKAQVAAVAVAIALAEQQTSLAHPLVDPPTAIVSAWQLGTRTRQLYEKGTPIVRKPRKIG